MTDAPHFSRQGDDFVLETRLLLKRARSEVFPFFADAGNLEAITPPWLRFRILTPLPLEMRVVALIDYRLRVHGIPLAWRSEITVYEPPQRFVDEQRRGPYRSWRHEHRFAETGQGTLVEDRVRYRVETVQNLLESFKTNRALLDLSSIAYDAQRGYKSVSEVISVAKRLEEPVTFSVKYVSDDLEELLNETYRKPGFRWRLESLNRSLGSLRKGTSGWYLRDQKRARLRS